MLLEKYCGHSADVSVISHGHHVYVRFVTDDQETPDMGFQIAFNTSVEGKQYGLHIALFLHFETFFCPSS